MNNHAVPLLSHHKQTARIFLFIVFFYSCAKIKHCWIFDRHLLQRLYHLSQFSSILVHNLNSFGQFCLSYHISLKHSKRCVHQLLCMLCTFSSHGDLLLKKKIKIQEKSLATLLSKHRFWNTLRNSLWPMTEWRSKASWYPLLLSQGTSPRPRHLPTSLGRFHSPLDASLTSSNPNPDSNYG